MIWDRHHTEPPEWLIAESTDGRRTFVVHTTFPRFVGEVFDTDDGGQDIENVVWFDTPPLEPRTLAKLMRKAGEALTLYDDALDT